MRRAAIFCAVLGLATAGVGCNVVTGQHDCTYDPSYMQLPATDYGGRPTHPVVGSPIGGATTAPAAMTPPAELPIPDKDGK